MATVGAIADFLLNSLPKIPLIHERNDLPGMVSLCLGYDLGQGVGLFAGLDTMVGANRRIYIYREN